MDRGDRLLLVRGALELAHPHAPEAQGRDDEPPASQVALVHGSLLPPEALPPEFTQPATRRSGFDPPSHRELIGTAGSIDRKGAKNMAQCEVCGNEYDKSFQVTMAGGDAHTFDSFECAIHALAPSCEHCGIRVIGHGVERSEE